MESVILCLIGGIIGLILGIGLATLIDFVTPDMIKSSVSLGSVLLAVSVSTLMESSLVGYQHVLRLKRIN